MIKNIDNNTANGDTTWCFACGENNPIGLKLTFTFDDKYYKTSFIAKKEHQSYNGIVHGGLISTLLDETLGGYVFHVLQKLCVTGELTVRYKTPLPIDTECFIKSEIVSHKGRLYIMKGDISLSDGTIIAEGTAKILEVKSI